MNSKMKIASYVGVGALAGALTTMSVQSIAQRAFAPLPLEQMQQLASVFGMLKTTYVEPVDEKKLITDAIKGMVTSLDPHSNFMEKTSLKEFKEGITGKFVGVGIRIGTEDGLVKVETPIEGSPAFRAGIKSQDLITKVDDKSMRGVPVDEVVKSIRGEPNTKVILTILRRSENNRVFSVTLTREEITNDSVRTKIVEPSYGYVRVDSFQERTQEQFATKMIELYKQDPNMKGLVFDLRNDPGGSLNAAIGISGAFLADNVTIVSTKGQLRSSNMVFKATPEFYQDSQVDQVKRLADATKGFYKTVPVVVLVNEGSASASEIVAGALQDFNRAKIMGSQTYGKGSVQTAHCLTPGVPLNQCESAALKITTSRYYTPKGNSIQARGIVPDILLDETAEGNLFAALRTREADLSKHLEQSNDLAYMARQKELEKQREQEREEARKRIEEFNKRPEAERRMPEYGSEKDFQLQQALRQLKGQAVQVSKTMVARVEDAKNVQAK